MQHAACGGAARMNKSILVVGAARTPDGLPIERGASTRVSPSGPPPGGAPAARPGRHGSGPGVAPGTGTGSRRRPRVLIVDDSEESRELYAWCMRAQGWMVDTVADGADALVAATALEPDVVLMDLRMPVLDGVEATRRLKAHPRTAGILVVALTAYANLHLEQMTYVPFDDVLQKPYPPEELVARLESMLRARAGGDGDGGGTRGV
jgi:CheY-like chemotaxis protein